MTKLGTLVTPRHPGWHGIAFTGAPEPRGGWAIKKQISVALGVVLLFVWTAAMAEERVRTSILVRYTTVPVEAVIYPEEDFEVKDTAAFVAQELCPILKREPVTFPVRYVIQWPKMLPDGASVVSDDSRTQAGVLADCLPRSHM